MWPFTIGKLPLKDGKDLRIWNECEHAVNSDLKNLAMFRNYQDQLLDPYTYVYNTPVFSKDGEAPVFYENAYQTDIIHGKAKAALKRLNNTEEPFFLWGKISVSSNI